MSDFLSQEDIDSLLSQQNQDGEGSDSSSGDNSAESGGGQTQAFGTFIEQLIAAAGDVLPTVTNKEVSLEQVDAQLDSNDAIKEAVGEESVVLTIPFEGGISGNGYWIFGKKPTAALSDLMVMGDGSAEYSEEHNDAIGEMIGQVFGSLTTALNDMIDESVSTSSVQVAQIDFSNPEFDISESNSAQLKLTLGDLGEYTTVFVIPSEAVDMMAERFPQNQQSGEDEDMSEGIGLSAQEQSDLSDAASAGVSSGGESGGSAHDKNIDMLLDIDLDVYIKLGETRLSIKRILDLGPGSIVELDKMAGEPVDLEVNNKVVAKGEVVVVDENFGIRIVSLVSPQERIKSLQ